MTIWISVIIYFSLAAVSFVRYSYYTMPKEKMVKRKTSRRKRRLTKEAAEKIVEKNFPIYEKKARKSRNLGVIFLVLFGVMLIASIAKILFFNESYNKIEVCVWKNETMGTSIDPISFMYEENSNSASEDEDDNNAGMPQGEAGKGAETAGENRDEEGMQSEEGNSVITNEPEDDVDTAKSIQAEGKDKDGLTAGAEDDIRDNGEESKEDGNSIEKTEGKDGGTDSSTAVKDGTSSKENVEESGTGNYVDNKTEETSGYQKGGQSGDSVDTKQEDSNSSEDTRTGEEGSINGMDAGEDSIIDIDPNKGKEQGSVSYDYSLLFFWGPYEFGDSVREQDLINIKNDIEEYFTDEKYNDIFNEIVASFEENEDYKNCTEEAILEKIENFKLEKDLNPDLLSAEKYFTNAMNNLFLYKENKNNEVLEQAAISVEGAVEKEQVSPSEGYDSYIRYDQTGVILFSYLYGLDVETYESGTKNDLKYRIGKLIYKPVANLLYINLGEKYYSLCGAYVILGDAFENWDQENKYAVEIPFYYFSVCTDLVKVMEHGEARKEVCNNAMKVYKAFEKIGEEHPDNSTYVMYAGDAEEKLHYIEQEFALEGS